MGQGMGWRCTECGAGEDFMLGCGGLSFNRDVDREAVKNGLFGIAAKILIESDDDIYTISHSVYYVCEECGGYTQGSALSISSMEDRKPIWALYCPEVCSVCGKEDTLCGDEPVSDKELHDRIRTFVMDGCPLCGGPVQEDFVCWD